MEISIIFLPLIGFLFCSLIGNKFHYRVSQILTTSFLTIAAIFSWIIFFEYLGFKETESQKQSINKEKR